MDALKSFLYIFLGTAIYSVVHSILASLWAKEQARRRFGAGADSWYRLFYNGFAVISLLPVLGMLAFMPDVMLYSIPFPVTIVTLTIQALAGLALAVGIWQTGVLSFLGLTAYLVLGAQVEERKLRKEFGEAYEEYARVTPMLVPDFSLGKKERIT